VGWEHELGLVADRTRQGTHGDPPKIDQQAAAPMTRRQISGDHREHRVIVLIVS